MIAEPFIVNMLTGIRRWVNHKFEEFGYTIASHITALTNKLDTVQQGAQVNAIETVKVNNSALTPDANKAVNITIPAATVTGIKTGDKILAFDGTNTTELTSTLSIAVGEHDSKKWIQIKGISNDVISEIDASDFIKDGMLDAASVHVRKTTSGTAAWTPALPSGVTEPSGWTKSKDGTYIVLTWNTASGKSTSFVNATSLVDIYTAGTGLSLNDHEFNLAAAGASTIGGVKVAAASTSGLTLGGDGALSIAAPSVLEVVEFLEDTTGDPADSDAYDAWLHPAQAGE